MAYSGEVMAHAPQVQHEAGIWHQRMDRHFYPHFQRMNSVQKNVFGNDIRVCNYVIGQNKTVLS